jgi:hypothetical protein
LSLQGHMSCDFGSATVLRTMPAFLAGCQISIFKLSFPLAVQINRKLIKILLDKVAIIIESGIESNAIQINPDNKQV